MTNPPPEGVLSLGLTERHGVFPKTELVPGRRGGLGRLSSEYAFFTPAIPYVFAGMTDFLWFEMSRELGHEVPILFWKSPVPLVGGLELPDGDGDWNHALWATPRMYWEYVLDFVASAVFYDRAAGRAAGFGVQELQLADALYLPVTQRTPGDRRPRAQPTVAVTAFGLNASDRRVAFDPLDARVGLPTVRNYPPTDDMANFAESLGKGDQSARAAS